MEPNKPLYFVALFLKKVCKTNYSSKINNTLEASFSITFQIESRVVLKNVLEIIKGYLSNVRLLFHIIIGIYKLTKNIADWLSKVSNVTNAKL